MQTLYLNWQLEPVLLGGLLAMTVAYYLAVGPLRSRLASGTPYPTASAALFGVALVLLFVNEGSPLHDLAERYLLSAHMLQHMLLSYLIAPLLLLATPPWLLRAALLNRALGRTARFALSPVVTFFAFTLVVGIYHVPTIYNASLFNTSLHHAIHFVILTVSLMLWWPILSPLAELPRPAFPARMAYLFLLPIAQIPVFAATIFSESPLYAAYANMPTRAFGLEVIADQRLAGLIMKIIMISVHVVAMAIVFFAWFRSERFDRPGAGPKGAGIPALVTTTNDAGIGAEAVPAPSK